VAFAPVDNPKIAVAVLAEHMGHGGSAAAPLAKEVIETFVKVSTKSGGTADVSLTQSQAAHAGVR